MNKQHYKYSQKNTCPGKDKAGTASNWLFPLLGLSSLGWFLIRVIPKPGRAAYPCMKVAAPLASTFVTYMLGLFTTVFVFRKARFSLKKSRYGLAAICLAAALISGAATFMQTDKDALAVNHDLYKNTDPLGPNNPIGEAKGIIPGRVVWVHDKDATDEYCEPTTNNDGYFLEKNNDQRVIDAMFSGAIKSLVNKETDAQAWQAIFEYFNEQNGHGVTGYAAGEKIFIKINSVHATNFKSDGSIQYNGDYGCVDTSPQAALAVLRQLVYRAGVPQDDIYIGDPYRKIFKHCYDMWHSEFPDIHYMVNGTQEGRETLKADSKKVIFYSDSGKVLTQTYDRLYSAMNKAKYIINLPALKGHRWAGTSFFPKNFFGANTRSGAAHLHNGTILPDWNAEARTGYGKYRVFVDIMGSKYLGRKSVLYVMDGLWATSYEHDPPCKFRMEPFNDDWCNSLFLSLDPVAIESVCLDFMQAEFAEADSTISPMRHTFVHYNGVDDYLHQAADPANWPEGFIYSPDGDGVPLPSLGVHEHWNNAQDRQYSRNLGTGEGIELVQAQTDYTDIARQDPAAAPVQFTLRQNYPNPFNPSTIISFELQSAAKVRLDIFNVTGQRIAALINAKQSAGTHTVTWNGRHDNGTPAASGIYLYRLTAETNNGRMTQEKSMTLLK